jgi:vacuolar-type H+-ATPase subunit H
VWKAFYDVRDVLAGFTGEKELNNFLDTLWDTYSKIDADSELNQWFWDFRNFVMDLMDNVKENKDELLEDAKEAGQKLAGEVKEKAIDKTEDLADKGIEISDKLEKKADRVTSDFKGGDQIQKGIRSAKRETKKVSRDVKSDAKKEAKDIKKSGEKIAKHAKKDLKEITEKALPKDDREKAVAMFKQGRKIFKKNNWSKQFAKLSKQFAVLVNNIRKDHSALISTTKCASLCKTLDSMHKVYQTSTCCKTLSLK